MDWTTTKVAERPRSVEATGSAEAIDPKRQAARAQSQEIVQLLRRSQGPQNPTEVRSIASGGLAGSGGRVPHAAAIQASFGPRFDVSTIEVHTGDSASDACESLGAEAFAMGERIGFSAAPTLRLAAHEAAHVVQQRMGKRPASGVGRPGDNLERHADRVANAVASGQSAEPLLDALSQGDETSAADSAVQMSNGGQQQGATPPPVPTYDVNDIINRSNIRVGDLCNEATGRGVMQDLSAGRLNALAPVNGPQLPPTFPPNNVEWGLGQLDNRPECCIIRGQEGPPAAVDWSKFPGVTGRAHSHPNANRIDALQSGAPLRDMLNQDVFNVGFLPSTSDLRYAAGTGGAHTVYTPFHHLGQGVVGNPCPGAPQPTFEVHLTNCRLSGTSTMMSKDVFQADARIVAGGDQLLTAQLWALWFSSPAFKADFTYFGSSPPEWARV